MRDFVFQSLPPPANERANARTNSNMYNRRVLAGEFTVVNKYLLRDLTERGLWTPEVRNQIIADQGSVQNVRQIPQELKDLYKTVWEIKQKFILNQVCCVCLSRLSFVVGGARDRAYVCRPYVG